MYFYKPIHSKGFREFGAEISPFAPSFCVWVDSHG